MNIHDKAYDLAKAIRASSEAQEWKAANAAAEGNPDSKRMLDDFRKRQSEIQQAMMEGREPSAEEMNRMNHLYQVIHMNPAVRRVMEAERRLGVLFDDVNRIVGEALHDIVGELS